MRVTNHYPVHGRLSSFISHSSAEYEVKRIDWVVLNCILSLKQNFFFALSEQMRHQSIEFIFLFEGVLVTSHERYTACHMRNSAFLSVSLIKQRRRIFYL